jgi:chemotaxis protein CheD
MNQPDRIWDRRLEQHVLRLMPGGLYVSGEDEILTTVLGSCVSACIRDVTNGIGGMNHFMLPRPDAGAALDSSSAGRYGTHAMKLLVDGIVERGGRPENFEIKIFGGGQITQGAIDVGAQNIEFIRRYLEEASLDVAAEDMGLAFPRKINYFVGSGRVMVKKLRALHSRSIAAEEQRYRGQAQDG